VTIYTGGPRRRTTKFLQEFEVATPYVMKSFALDALRFSPTASLNRAQEQVEAQSSFDVVYKGQHLKMQNPSKPLEEQNPVTEVLSIDEQQARIDEAQVPLKPEEGLRQGTLELLITRKQEEVAHAGVLQRATAGQMAVGLGAGILASMVDPLNVASAFIPVVGPSRYARMVARQTSRTGRALVRARVGALEGFVGAGLVEPIVAAQAYNEQADYTMADTLLNFAFGTVMGGGLHMGVGALGDRANTKRQQQALGAMARRLSEMTPAQREDLFRSNMALAVDDRTGVAPFRLVDIADNENITDAGLTDPGTPLTAAFEITESRVVSGDRVPADINAAARKINPALFVRLDNLRETQTSLRQQLARVGTDRPKAAKVTAIDNEIGELRARQDGATKRKIKKIEAKIDELETKKAKLVKAETPVMQKLRSKLSAVDELMRDIAPEVTAVLREGAGVIHQGPVRVGSQQPTKSAFHATGIRFDEVELARLQSVDNLRLANTEFTSVVDRDLLPSDAFDTVAAADEGITLETERLEEVIGQAGEDARPAMEAIKELEMGAAQAAIAADTAYAKGLRAMAVCATGKGG